MIPLTDKLRHITLTAYPTELALIPEATEDVKDGQTLPEGKL